MKTLREQVLHDNFVRYEAALKRIASAQPYEEIQRTDIGLDYAEHLEMAYENLIFEAMQALDGTF